MSGKKVKEKRRKAKEHEEHNRIMKALDHSAAIWEQAREQWKDMPSDGCGCVLDKPCAAHQHPQTPHHGAYKGCLLCLPWGG